MDLPLGELMCPESFDKDYYFFHLSPSIFNSNEIINVQKKSDRMHLSFFTDKPLDQHKKSSDYLARWNVEKIFEEVRTAEFSEFPSRKEVLFSSLNLTDAKQWKSKPARSDYTLYKVLPLAKSKIILVDYVWYNYAIRVWKDKISALEYVFKKENKLLEVIESAKNYWSGICFSELSKTPYFGIEVLIFGDIKVISKIDIK